MKFFKPMKDDVVALPVAHLPETFLSVAYGAPVQVGQITRVYNIRGRAVAQTTSGIPFLFPAGGFDIDAYLDHLV